MVTFEKCKKPETPPIKEHSGNEIKILTSLVLELVKSNTDLQKQITKIKS